MKKGYYKTFNDINKLELENALCIAYSKIENLPSFDEVNYVNCSQIGTKTLLVSPINFDNLTRFNKIIFLEQIESENIISYLNERYPNIDIYANINRDNSKNIALNKKLILQVFNELKKIKEPIFDSIYLFKKYFNKLSITFKDLLTSITILDQLNCVKFDKDNFVFINTDQIDEKEFDRKINELENFLIGK